MSAPSGTAKHRAPRTPDGVETRAALIAAFPISAGLPAELGNPLGRDWLAARDIQDSEVSGLHFELRRIEETFQLRDLASRNGTWLDGRPLPPNHWMDLREGAVIRIGSSLLVFRSAFSGALAPEPPLGALVSPYGLRALAHSLASIAQTRPDTVLIVGETGTGKELVALEVARALGRDTPYAAVNMAAVPHGVFEAQLFGHVAGAFSDAKTTAPGVLATHDGGTVFLDEIGELPLGLQPKLLRVVDNREVLPVGGARPRKIDVLLVCATNRNLEELVAAGSFRQDLFARLDVTTLRLPSLRERVEDVFPMLQRLTERVGMSVRAEDSEVEAVERLLLHDWPHNVRSLIAFATQLRGLAREPGIHLWAVERLLGPLRGAAAGAVSAGAAAAALDACSGNESEAARHLGVSRGKLRRLLGKA
jgi:transcriptional regulator with AAA-type ATPase domain